MNLTIIGSGYVGLTTSACFAEAGHRVVCVDNDPRKIEFLLQGHIPIYEPELEALFTRNIAAKSLAFTTNTEEEVKHGEAIFIAVPTPPQPDGSVDLSFIEKIAREIADHLTDYRVIVDKSTVPVKTGERVAQPSPAIRSRAWSSMWSAIPNFCAKAVPSMTSCIPTASS